MDITKKMIVLIFGSSSRSFVRIRLPDTKNPAAPAVASKTAVASLQLKYI
jgi:hypothetical protein